MSDYFDRQGRPVDLMTFCQRDPAERRVARTQVGAFDVSTVHLGLNHRFGPGPPLIFETMIFGDPFDTWCSRYSTETQAADGHARFVAILEDFNAGSLTREDAEERLSLIG